MIVKSFVELTVHVPDLVAHGVPHQLMLGVVHDKHLFHSQHLGLGHLPGGLGMGAALVGDGLPPLVFPGLRGTILQADHVLTRGGGCYN